MEKEKLFDFTDKVIKAVSNKDVLKNVVELQIIIKEIWKDGGKSNRGVTNERKQKQRKNAK